MVRTKKEYVYFYNDTYLPVIVDGWKQTLPGLSSLVSTKVEPLQTILVHSSAGEWHMHSMFLSDEDKVLWKGFEKYYILGKFWSKPSIMGEYSSMEFVEPFYCTYDEVDFSDETIIKGRITFSMKNGSFIHREPGIKC